MVLSFEVPRCLLEESRKFNEYDYFLDVFIDDKNFYKESLEAGRTVYLANSLYERHKYGLGFDETQFKKLVDTFSAYDNFYFVVPDFFNCANKNIQKVEEYKNFKNKIVVLHGRNLNEMRLCLEEYLKIINKNDIVAMPFGDDVFREYSRPKLLSLLNIPNRVHILGSKNPQELFELATARDKIFSMDTSLPICASIEGKNLTRQSPKPAATIYGNYNIDTIDKELIKQNINFVKGVFNV